MIEAYSIGVRLKLNDLVTPQLLKLADELAKYDSLVLKVNKHLGAMGAKAVGIRNLADASKRLAANMAAIKDASALVEKNLLGVRMALPSGGLGLEAELIAANVQARTLAATLSGIRGAGRIPGGGHPPPLGGGGRGGGRHGGGIHGGNLHMGPSGVGVSGVGVGVGLMGDALVPLGAAMVAGYVGKQFYEGAKDYQDAFMRFKSLNLGDKTNAEADKFASSARPYGVSQTELMKALGESVGLFGSFEEAKKYTPMLVSLGTANSAIFGEKLGALDDEGLKSLLKFMDRRGGFKDEATFARQLDLAEKMITGSAGFLHFQDIGAFSQNAGTAFRSLSDQGLLHMEGLLIEQGGQKAGTALMSLYQNLVGGRTPVKTMRLMENLGLGHISPLTTGTVGGKKSTGSKFELSPEYMKLAQTDPAEFMGTVIPRLLAKKGITSESDVLKAVNDILSNRTASNQGSLMTTQQFQLIRDFKLAQGAMGADKVISMFKDSASGAEADFDAAWTDFKKQFGTTMLPQITNMLKVGADMLRTLGDVTGSRAFKDLNSAGFGAMKAFAWPYRLMLPNSNAANAEEPKMAASPHFLPNPGKPVQLSTTINIDGRKLGEAVTSYLLDGFGKPQSTSSGFDMTRAAPPIGHSYVK